jgi:PAS domain S-box-containing protein
MQITKVRSQLLIRLEQVAVHLRRAQNTLSTLGEGVANKTLRLQRALRARKNDLRKLLASSLDAIRVTNGTITKFGSELLIKVRVWLRQAENTLSVLGESVAEKPRRLQEALRDRENGLRKLLASSPDAIVVTNGDHRFVAANPKALGLFGISETNMRKFTIDAFLPGGQLLAFDAKGLPFMKRVERHGKCKIRRLDGSLRVAEYVFVANFVPLRHVSRFHDITRHCSNSRCSMKSDRTVINHVSDDVLPPLLHRLASKPLGQSAQDASSQNETAPPNS